MDNPIAGIIQKIQGLATNAAKPELSEPGPGDVQPTTETKDGTAGLVTLEMDEDEVGEWFKRIDLARARIKAREGKWDILLNEYLPVVEASGTAESVKANSHFRNVHSKIGQLFYRSPDLLLETKDPSPAQNLMPNPMGAMQPPGSPPLPPLTMEDIIAVKQAVLMDKLGREGIKAGRLMDELLFDMMAWAGIGCCKVGYRCVMKPIQQPVMGPDPTFNPNAMQPSILGIATPPPAPPMVPQTDPLTGQPKMETVTVPVYEEWYARRFSPKKLLVNADLTSSRFDEDATFMGMDFYMSPKKAMAVLGLTEEEATAAAEDDRRHLYKEDQEGGQTKPGLIHGMELSVKASVFTDEVHPQAMYQLILIDGLKTRPAVWRPSPDQTFNDKGRLTDDSVIGFPFRVLTTRDLADSPFPPADSAFTNSGIKQLGTWRRQSIAIRDAAIGKYLVDAAAFEDTELDKLKNGGVGEFVEVGEGKLAQGGDKIFTTTAQVHGTADDVRGQEMIQRDVDETLGISSVQAGTPEKTVRTATEIANVQTAVAGRNDKELSRVTDFYLDLARMIDQLIMRYADDNEYIRIAGTDGGGKIQMWNKQMVSGRYLYSIAPDSQNRVDTARDYQQLLNLYNMAAQDRLFNRAYVLRRLARMKGLDPSKVVMPADQVAMQPPHGGTAGPGATVSQHTASNSGGRPNEPGMVNHRAEQVK